MSTALAYLAVATHVCVDPFTTTQTYQNTLDIGGRVTARPLITTVSRRLLETRANQFDTGQSGHYAATVQRTFDLTGISQRRRAVRNLARDQLAHVGPTRQRDTGKLSIAVELYNQDPCNDALPHVEGVRYLAKALSKRNL